MNFLLDTHTFLWWDSDPGRLSAPALAALRDPANEVWLSAASVWEMVIKAQLGKLSLRQPRANGLQLLPVDAAHVLGVEGLPTFHNDPFDRVLVAQAKAEGADLVS